MVPPHVHPRNASERAIRTYKTHLITGLCTYYPKFHVREWDCLLPQASLTLNLLRSSRKNSSVSAYAGMFGNFDFTSTPLAPPRTKVLIHAKPSIRRTFGSHAIDGWYIGSSLDHYRCYFCYVPEIGYIRHADTV